MTRVVVTVPVRTWSEPNMRGGWRSKWRRSKYHRETTVLLVRVPASRIGFAAKDRGLVVTMTRFAPSNGLDDDNLRGALKAVRDGVAEVLGLDDGDRRLRWEYGQRRGPYAVVVEIDAAQS